MTPTLSSKKTPCGRPASAQKVVDKQKLLEWKERLSTYVAEQGLKNSEQRWKIAETILLSGGHLDAQSLFEKVTKQHPGIGAATVYRTLKVLCAASILKESLTASDGRVIYELYDEDHHDHIVCVDCGHIFEFHSEKLETLQNKILDELKFTEEKHRHVIYAKCSYRK